MKRVDVGPELDDFKKVAHALIALQCPPTDIRLFPPEAAQAPLLDVPLELPDTPSRTVTVPRAFGEAATWAALHRSPERWDLLYRLLWRIHRGEHALLQDALDGDTRALQALVREVKEDLHKAEAFVRFRKVEADGVEHFIAWHRTDHRVLQPLAAFFLRRFPAMRWTLLTPDGSAHYDGSTLRFGPAVSRSEAPGEDALEPLWRTYYASTFNPARLNERLMRKEMPVRYWGSLPEASLLPSLIHGAKARTQAMVHRRETPSASEAFLPPERNLKALAAAAKGCTACPLYASATQTVFGEGPAHARLIMVGEQPGDSEDRDGHPFVGPAGRLLDDMLQAAGIERQLVYVTNAVKHFKWERGETKRRLHARPNRAEVLACQGWLMAELLAVKPKLIVCLGATAASSLMGASFKLLVNRGKVFDVPWAERGLMATYHPSALLRADPLRVEQMRKDFLKDLKLAATHLQPHPRSP